MRRSTLHLTVDSLMALGAVGLILTGLLIAFVLPAGSRQASVWGMTRHDWGDVHFWFAMAILATALLHLVLNWGWVCSVIALLFLASSPKPTLRRQLITGVGTLLVLTTLVGGFLYAADVAKIPDLDGRGRGQAGHQLENDLQDLFLIDP